MSLYLEDKMQAPSQPSSSEFEVLGKQVKQILQGMAATGQWAEAYGVAEQLMALLPDDLEVIRLKQEILQHI